MIPKGTLVGPVKLFFSLILLWSILAITSPIEYTVDYRISNVAFLISLFLCLFIGLFTGQSFSKKIKYTPSDVDISFELKKTILPVLFYLGVIGAFLKVYVLFFVKGVPLTLDPIIIRLALLNDVGVGKGGSLSIVSAILFPLLYLYIPLFFTQRKASRGLKTKLLVVLFFIIADGVLSGGGTSIIVAFLFFIFSTNISKLSRSQTVLIVLTSFLLFGFASYMWLLRLETMYGGVQSYMQIFNGYWIASYNDWFMRNYDEYSVLWQLYYVYSWVNYYFVHGVYEFLHLVNLFESEHTYGMSQIQLFYKLFGMIGLASHSVEDISSVNIISGHYQTFWGLAFIDFGYFSLIEALLIGFLCSYIYYSKIAGRFVGIIFYPYLQAQLVYSFLSNSLIGQVTYIVFSGLLLLFVLKIIKWRVNEENRRFAVEQVL